MGSHDANSLSLDMITGNPAAAAALSGEQRSSLMIRIAALMTALALPQTLPLSAVKGQSAEEPNDPLLNVKEAAQRLRFAPSYVYELIRRRDLPAVKVGKYVRIKNSDIDRFVSRHREAATLDKSLSNVLSKMNASKNDGGRGQEAARVAGTQANRPRRALGRPSDDGIAMGARLRFDPGSRREAAPSLGRGEPRPQGDQGGLNGDGENLEA
jgi:excisionase family DNA binding protein